MNADRPAHDHALRDAGDQPVHARGERLNDSKARHRREQLGQAIGDLGVEQRKLHVSRRFGDDLEA